MAIEDTTQVYILTEEGRAYNQEGIDFVLGQIRGKFDDHTDVSVNEGALYNDPDVLARFLRKNPEHSYVFISHANGLEIMYDVDDINRFAGLLENASDPEETSWSLIMKELYLLQ